MPKQNSAIRKVYVRFFCLSLTLAFMAVSVSSESTYQEPLSEAEIRETSYSISVDIESFWRNLQSTPIEERTYAAFEFEYYDIEMSIKDLLKRMGMGKYSEILQVILALWREDQKFHSNRDSFYDYDAECRRQQYARLFEWIHKNREFMPREELSAPAPSALPLPESEPPVTEGPIPMALPSGHLWQYLYSYGAEEKGYATYSYILVGSDESNPNTARLYFALVKEIQSSTVSADILPEDASKAHFNLFLIPATGSTNDAPHKPNYELSKLLLAALSTASSQSFSGPGPYIITLFQPISFGENAEVADIFFLDLTNIHPTAIPVVVSTYKRKVESEHLDGIERLKSLRLSLLNLALIAEDSIGFAKVAYAELKNSFLD